MSVNYTGEWATDLPRRRRTLTDDRRRLLEDLLGKKRLDGYERGQLRALMRDADGADRERAERKLHGSPQRGVTAQQVGEEITKAISKALDAEDDRAPDRGWFGRALRAADDDDG